VLRQLLLLLVEGLLLLVPHALLAVGWLRLPQPGLAGASSFSALLPAAQPGKMLRWR
jgi:hypothetical protein